MARVLEMVPTSVLKELCADPDRMVLLPDGMGMAVSVTPFPPGDPFLSRLNAGPPPSAGVFAIFPTSEALRSPLLWNLLERQPREALDGLLLGLPPGPVSLYEMGELADTLRVDVMVAVGDVVADDRSLANARNRVVLRDARRSPTTAADPVLVSVASQSNRAENRWAGAPDEALAILAGHRYLPGWIVFGPGGAELGLPAALVTYRHGATLRAHGLAGVSTVDDAALDAAGADPAEVVGGYPDLMVRLARMDPGEAGKQALVLLDGADGGPDRTFLALVEAAKPVEAAEPDGVNVSFVDLATSAPDVFPDDFGEGRLRLAALPGSMSLAERLDALASAWPGSRTGAGQTAGGEPAGRDVPALDGIDRHTWSTGNSTATLDIIGEDIPGHDLNKLIEAAELLEVPIVALGGSRKQEPTTARLELLARRLAATYQSPDPQTPIVYTSAQVSEGSPLTDMLDTWGVVLVYQAPGWDGGGLLNLGNPFRIRPPRHDPEPPPPPQDLLDAAFLTLAKSRRQKPDIQVPSPPAASLLSTSLKDPGAISTVLDRYGSRLPELHEQVAKIADEVPSFAGHHAVLSLAKPMLETPAGSPQQRAEQIRAAAPHLAELAGVEFTDKASHDILAAIGDLIENRRSVEEVTLAVHMHWRSLPREGQLVSNWIRVLGAVAGQDWVATEHKEALNRIGEIIASCPDEDPKVAPAST